MRSRNIAYIAKLDHLRFFAAFLVIVYHYYHFQTGFYNGFKLPAVIAKSAGSALIIEGHVGVSLFLVLSGFIFSAIGYGKQINYKAFIANRLLRIMPLYGLAIFVAAHLKPTTLAEWISSLTFMSSFIPGVNDVRVTPHLWTIAVEFQFYLIFPLIVVFLKRYGLRYAGGAIMLLVVLRGLMWCSREVLDLKSIVYGTLIGRMDQFLIGMVAGAVYSGRGPKWHLGFLKRGWSVLLGTAVAVGSIWIFHRCGGFYHLGNKHWIWIIWTPLEGCIWALLIMTYVMSSFQLPGWLSRTLSFLGSLSFSLYVNHWIFVNNMPFHKWIPLLSNNYSSNAFLSVLLVVLPLLTAFSWLTHQIIERPFFELRKSYILKDLEPKSGAVAEKI